MVFLVLPLIFAPALDAGPVDIPSPAWVQLRAASHVHFAGLLMAQAEESEGQDKARRLEEKALESDMDRAREHLGHGEGRQADEESPATEPEAMEEDMDRAREHLGHDDPFTGEASPSPSRRRRVRRNEYYDDAYEDERPPPRRRLRKRVRSRRLPPGYEAPTLDGHGKGYYLAWGIGEWAAAGVMWGGTLLSGLLAAGLWSVANQSRPLSETQRYPDRNQPERRWYKRDYRRSAVTLTVVAAVLAAGGGIIAWRAGSNIGHWKDLRAQQRADLATYRERPRRRRQ